MKATSRKPSPTSMRSNGGLLTLADMASFRSRMEAPASIRFRDLTVYSCGPWCQGPVLLQMLEILKGIDLVSLGHNSPAYVHTVTEAMKLALADREAYYGDPRFVDVPLAALSASGYADERRRLLDDRKACDGLPPPGKVGGRSEFAANAPHRGPDRRGCGSRRWIRPMSAWSIVTAMRSPLRRATSRPTRRSCLARASARRRAGLSPGRWKGIHPP